MRNEFNVNLCDYCSRCHFCKLDKNGKRVYVCKFAEPHSYKVSVCPHYLFNLHFFVPKTSLFTKIFRTLKHLLRFIFYPIIALAKAIKRKKRAKVVKRNLSRKKC